MTRVAQIIPYFGRWPEWFDLYVYSCGRNKMIDFIFFTDCDDNIVDKPDNVIVKRITFDDYLRLVSDRLGINYNIKSSYKLTDLKPFLGLIHKDILSGYDWWGFGDIDLVYGNMGLIVNERNLRKYNLITTHNYHIAGHCTFMRNNEYYRNICLGIRDWQHRLSDENHYGFDEAEWSNLVYESIRWPRKLYDLLIKRINPGCFNRFMDFANRLINPKELFKEFHTSPAPKNNQKWIYDLESGKVISPDNIELPYLHFLFFKKTPWYETDLYWKEGFYNLSPKINDYDMITIDIDHIDGRNHA